MEDMPEIESEEVAILNNQVTHLESVNDELADRLKKYMLECGRLRLLLIKHGIEVDEN